MQSDWLRKARGPVLAAWHACYFYSNCVYVGWLGKPGEADGGSRGTYRKNGPLLSDNERK